jgi:hypothetical protein
MMVFVFQSGADQDVFGFTRDEDGANLPAEFEPWQQTGSQAMPVGAQPHDPLVRALDTDGYYLARASEGLRS